jgi:hypothetical protein
MANNILITPASASIQFSGSAANTIRLVVEDSGSVAFYGDSGSLFGINSISSRGQWFCSILRRQWFSIRYK